MELIPAVKLSVRVTDSAQANVIGVPVVCRIDGVDYATGKTYGNGLAGPRTVVGIVSGFLRHPDAPLEDRLLEALEGGREAGGQASKGVPRPERSAWIRVVGQLDHPEVDVRVDLHDKSVTELRRVLEEFKRCRDYYNHASEHPSVYVVEENRFC